MGRAIARLAFQDPQITINGGIEHKNHKLVGKDLGLVLGEKPIKLLITDDEKTFFKDIDVVIEFGLEEATLNFLKHAHRNRVAFISGSTGLSHKTLKMMKKLSKNIPILWSPNMSIGANIIKEIAGELAIKLGNDFDIDITDIHHKNKADNPSGTALAIKESIQKFLKTKNFKKRIGIHAIRAGDSTGEHSVIFSGKNERITIKHISTSRDIFSYGALEIAKWLNGKKAGLYGMKDFLITKS